MQRKKKASLPGLSQSLLLIPNWDSWVNQTHCRGLLWFPSWVFQILSLRWSCGFLSANKAWYIDPLCSLLVCLILLSSGCTFHKVFYSLCTVPLETFSPPRLREPLLFLQAKTPNTPTAGCFWVIPGDVSVEGKMKFFSFCRGTIVKVVSLSKHLTVCGGDRLGEHCSKRWRGLKTEIVIFCWCTLLLFYTALLSCPLNAEVF